MSTSTSDAATTSTPASANAVSSSQTTAVTAVSVPNSATDYVSQGISKLVLTSFDKMNKSDTSITKVLGGIAVLILAESFKTVAVNLVKESVPTLTLGIKTGLKYTCITMPTHVYEWVRNIRLPLPWSKTNDDVGCSAQFDIDTELINAADNKLEISVLATIVEQFAQYLVSNNYANCGLQNVQYNMTLNESATQFINHDMQTSEMIHNVSFTLDEIPFRLNNNLHCTFVNGKIKENCCQTSVVTMSLQDVKQFWLNDMANHHTPNVLIQKKLTTEKQYVYIENTKPFSVLQNSPTLVSSTKLQISVELYNPWVAATCSYIMTSGHHLKPTATLWNCILERPRVIPTIVVAVFRLFETEKLQEFYDKKINRDEFESFYADLYYSVVRYIYWTYVASNEMPLYFPELIKQAHSTISIENIPSLTRICNTYPDSFRNRKMPVAEIPANEMFDLFRCVFTAEIIELCPKLTMNSFLAYKQYIDHIIRKQNLAEKTKYHELSKHVNIWGWPKDNAVETTPQATTKLIPLTFCVPSGCDKRQLCTKLQATFVAISKELRRGTTNKEVTLNRIHVLKDVTTTDVENPDYKAFMERKKQLEETGIAKEQIAEELGIPPVKVLKSVKTDSKLVVKSVGKKYANFLNLYLPKQQDVALQNLLDTFCNDKVEAKAYGIPNKLGICLYGPPGCGKTTLIATIASYLGLDLFYAQINGLSNNELSMIFDHVNSTNVNGGIIVIEDIDNVSPAVLNATARDRRGITMSSNDTSFTLDHLLNLLDGAMTYENSVVIMTTNFIEDLEPSLLRPGRVDSRIELSFADHWQIRKLFARIVGRNLEESVLQSIKEKAYSPAQLIFHLRSLFKSRHTYTDAQLLEPFLSKGALN